MNTPHMEPTPYQVVEKRMEKCAWNFSFCPKLGFIPLLENLNMI